MQQLLLHPWQLLLCFCLYHLNPVLTLCMLGNHNNHCHYSWTSPWRWPPNFARCSWEPSIGLLGNSRKPLLGAVVGESWELEEPPPTGRVSTAQPVLRISVPSDTQNGMKKSVFAKLKQADLAVNFGSQKYPSKIISPETKLYSESRASPAFLHENFTFILILSSSIFAVITCKLYTSHIS